MQCGLDHPQLGARGLWTSIKLPDPDLPLLYLDDGHRIGSPAQGSPGVAMDFAEFAQRRGADWALAQDTLEKGRGFGQFFGHGLLPGKLARLKLAKMGWTS
jgi:hypothetical protein